MHSGAAPAPDDRASLHARELELVRRALGRDPAALRALDPYLAKVSRIVQVQKAACGIAIAPQELPDVVQDCLALVWRKLPDYEGRAALTTWLFRVVSFELRNAARRVAKRRRDAAPQDAARRPDPQSREPDISARLRALEIEELLGRLEPTPMEVLRLRHFEERTFDEIATLLAMNPSRVKTIYYRALQRLHEMLRARGEGDDAS